MGLGERSVIMRGEDDDGGALCFLFFPFIYPFNDILPFLSLKFKRMTGKGGGDDKSWVLLSYFPALSPPDQAKVRVHQLFLGKERIGGIP